MTEKLTVQALPAPTMPVGVPADVVANGQMIPAIERIRIFNDVQWEEFVLEWADSLRDKYDRVERCGGAGDMGRDIIAICKDDNNIWDNYQCKHYKNPIMPSDIWVELGKLVYYTKMKYYTYPRRYFFVAPQGAGTRLSNLLRNPEQLRSQLKQNWDKYCLKGITSTTEIELDAEISDYLDQLDFSIFEAKPPLRLIDEHAKTRWYVARFGGGLPQRPPMDLPPVNPTQHEVIYIRQLLDAYSDHLRCPVMGPADISMRSDLQEHFNDSRLEFYSAESLRNFSRDTLPPGEFEKLQEEIHDGIKDDVRADYEDGYRRVISVVKSARLLQLTDHALIHRLSTRDRGGICHQLANDKKIRWVK